MSVNKVSFTINSRQYTVVAEESVEYIEKLCEHINDKVESVIKGGQNILGERPIVLAALNVCDEYYKSLNNVKQMQQQMKQNNDKNSKLQQTVKYLQKELDSVKSGQVSIEETELRAEAASAKNELDDAEKRIKFLEGHIKTLEDKIQELEEKYDKREQEIMEMIEES